MNAALVRQELLRLRDERFKTKAEFEATSHLYGQLIRQVERGSTPRLEALELWVNACGLTLSQFFANIEALEHGRRKKIKGMHPLIPAAHLLAERNPDVAAAILTIVRPFLRGERTGRK